MGRKRYIDTSFWDDAWIQELDPSEKFLYLYLLTNPLTNVAGISELTVKRICFDTGFNDDTVRNILRKYELSDKVYTWNNYIILKNAPKHQLIVKPENDEKNDNTALKESKNKTKENNIYKGIIAILNDLPDELLEYLYHIEYAFEDLTDVLDEKGIDYTEILTISDILEQKNDKYFEGASRGFEGALRNSNYINLNSDSDLNSNSDLNSLKQKKVKKVFIPPTLEEITAYIQEKHYSVNPKTFFDYYTETEWKDVSGKKIKNWKGKVVTWNSRNTNSQNNYQKNNNPKVKKDLNDPDGWL